MRESAEKFLEYLEQLKRDGFDAQPDPKLIEAQFVNVMHMPDMVTYVADYRSGQIVYHHGFNSVLGYPQGCKIDIPFVLNVIHPDDQPVVHYLSQLATEFHFTRDRKEPFRSMLEMNYRVRKFHGDHIMMLKRSTGFINDGDAPVMSMTMLHDISFMDVKKIHSRILGPKDSERLYREKLKELHESRHKVGPFSQRETQVLALMAQGFRSRDIADTVHLSVHTIHNHRKNMMRKTGLKNTADLIRYGLENGLL
ncbi:MAG: hypothetical protein GC178_14195 [Flavobacteriales bacterium]|nr:hypothetical protein [Flavobacteriales bacterium]